MEETESLFETVEALQEFVNHIAQSGLANTLVNMFVWSFEVRVLSRRRYQSLMAHGTTETATLQHGGMA